MINILLASSTASFLTQAASKPLNTHVATKNEDLIELAAPLAQSLHKL